MPRKPLIYTNEFPYHVVARCNSQDWFHAPIDDVWQIFKSEIYKINQTHKTEIHAFVLMNNHYHMILTCSEKKNLAEVMRDFQTQTSRKINRISGRTNHVYGSRYRASLITDEYYYANALKYLYQNPVRANICKSVFDYKYSSIQSLYLPENCELPISSHLFGEAIYKSKIPLAEWLYSSFSDPDYKKIKLGLTRSVFLFRKNTSALRKLL